MKDLFIYQRQNTFENLTLNNQLKKKKKTLVFSHQVRLSSENTQVSH